MGRHTLRLIHGRKLWIAGSFWTGCCGWYQSGGLVETGPRWTWPWNLASPAEVGVPRAERPKMGRCRAGDTRIFSDPSDHAQVLHYLLSWQWEVGGLNSSLLCDSTERGPHRAT